MDQEQQKLLNKCLSGILKLYENSITLAEQIQQLDQMVRQTLTRVEAIEKSVGTVERTAVKEAGRKPWEHGWAKDKAEDDTPIEKPAEDETVKKVFKI